MTTAAAESVVAGVIMIQLSDVSGLSPGMSLTISDGANSETKTIVAVALAQELSSSSRRLAAGSVTVDSPMQYSYAAGSMVTAMPAQVIVTTSTTTEMKMVDSNADNITSTATATTTAEVDADIATQVALAINSIVLTDIFLHAATIGAGVIMIVVGRKFPTLLAGNLVLAIFLGMLMKTGQAANAEVSQWPFWPGIVAVSGFASVSVLIKLYRDIMVGVITGIVLAALSLAVTVGAELPVWTFKSFPKEAPWGLIAAVLFYIVGHVSAAKFTDRPLLYPMLSALIGGFLIAHGSLFFLYERDFAEEICSAIVRAAVNSEEDRSSIARDVRPQVAGWLILSVGLFILRSIAIRVWDKHKPQRFRKNDEAGVSSKDCEEGVKKDEAEQKE